MGVDINLQDIGGVERIVRRGVCSVWVSAPWGRGVWYCGTFLKETSHLLRGLFSPKENTVVTAIRAKKARKVCHLQKPLRTHNKRAERRNFLLLLLSLSLLFCALIRGLAGFYGEFSLWSLSGSGWLSHSQRCSRKILAFCHTILKVQFLSKKYFSTVFHDKNPDFNDQKFISSRPWFLDESV